MDAKWDNAMNPRKILHTNTKELKKREVYKTSHFFCYYISLLFNLLNTSLEAKDNC